MIDLLEFAAVTTSVVTDIVSWVTAARRGDGMFAGRTVGGSG